MFWAPLVEEEDREQARAARDWMSAVFPRTAVASVDGLLHLDAAFAAPEDTGTLLPAESAAAEVRVGGDLLVSENVQATAVQQSTGTGR